MSLEEITEKNREFRGIQMMNLRSILRRKATENGFKFSVPTSHLQSYLSLKWHRYGNSNVKEVITTDEIARKQPGIQCSILT